MDVAYQFFKSTINKPLRLPRMSKETSFFVLVECINLRKSLLTYGNAPRALILSENWLIKGSNM